MGDIKKCVSRGDGIDYEAVLKGIDGADKRWDKSRWWVEKDRLKMGQIKKVY